MAWGSTLAAQEEATAEAVTPEALPTNRLFFDATLYEPANEEYLEALEESAQNQKTQAEVEAEKKEALLWSIAENRLLSETARVSALRLLHEIQLWKTGESELWARIQELEAKLTKTNQLRPARGRSKQS
jgi:hypothetical protein